MAYLRAVSSVRGFVLAIPLLAAACSHAKHTVTNTDPSAGSGTDSTTQALDPCPVPPADDGTTFAISLAAVKQCVANSPPDACLDGLFRDYMTKHTTQEALALLQCYEDHDTDLNVGCHPIAHSIGRETYTLQKTVDASFTACDQTCHSGCYHGAMERFLRGGSTSTEHLSLREIRDRATTACDDTLAGRYRFQCLHGLGHAVMYFSEYALEDSLTICDSTGEGRSSCYGGVFMENLVSATPEKRDVSPTDYHYPCSKLADQYKWDCYGMQTSRMVEMGLTEPQIVVECGKAGGYTDVCMQSMGRDLSNYSRAGSGGYAAETCELGEGSGRQACTRGVVYALADNTWDGKYALAYCPLYKDEADQSYCFDVAISYLRSVYEKTNDDLKSECQQWSPGNDLCVKRVDA